MKRRAVDYIRLASPTLRVLSVIEPSDEAVFRDLKEGDKLIVTTLLSSIKQEASEIITIVVRNPETGRTTALRPKQASTELSKLVIMEEYTWE